MQRSFRRIVRPFVLAAVAALTLITVLPSTARAAKHAAPQTAPQTADTRIDPDLLAGLKARSIGPAAMSGRVTDIQGVESNPDILYVGAAAGGVWKSVNGGLTW
jgi:hypothetical protein